MSGLSERQRRSIEELQKEFTEIIRPLSKAERLIIGKFIGLRMKMGFDTGLRMGLISGLTIDENKKLTKVRDPLEDRLVGRAE